MKKLLLSFLLFGIALLGFTQNTIIKYGDSWLYKDDGSDQNTLMYQQVLFPLENTWTTGKGQFGYGDGDETTYINACGTATQYPTCTNKFITTYFRKTITITSNALFNGYTFNIKRDDGAIVYVNGTELFRTNMPAGAVTSTTLATGDATDDGNTAQSFSFNIAASKLILGANVIAVEIHQSSTANNDMSFDMQVVANYTPAFSAKLIRGPYQQILNTQGVTLKWRTDSAVTSLVKYGTDSLNLDNTVEITGNRLEHIVALSGLIPHTQYYYSIGSNLGKLQGNGQNYFLTAPIKGTEGNYTFWVTGDCGNNSTNQRNVLRRYNEYAGNKITDGWLTLGDNAYTSGTEVEFQGSFFNIYQESIMKKAALWPAPGNHDYENAPTRQNDHAMPYYDIFETPSKGQSGGVASNTKAYYSYDYGNVHFLSLDSYGNEDNLTRMYDTLGKQVTWIKSDLAANKLPFVIAYWHHPPYTMASHNSDAEAELVLIRTNFIQILERMGVDMVMCGHSHGYERSKLMKGNYGMESSFVASTHNVSQSTGMYNGSTNSCTYVKDSTSKKAGIVYVVAGSAGQLGGSQSTYPHDAMTYSDVTHGGSFVINVIGNRMDSKWLDEAGLIRDQFTIMKETNKKTSYFRFANDSITLTASWNGDFRWLNRAETTKSIRVKVTDIAANYIVTDLLQCVADTFIVNSFTVLPVNITSLSAKNLGLTNSIAWATGTEANNNYFNVQKSYDGVNFINIGKVNSKAIDGISNKILSYTFIDEAPYKALNFYRLQSVNKDGKITVSSIVKLVSAQSNFLSIYPNPAQTVINLSLDVNPLNNVTLNLVDVSGKLIKSFVSKNKLGKTLLIMDISKIKAGLYLMQVVTGNQLIYTEKITKIN